MALVSGPTVGDAISDPDNAVAKLVAEVADNGELVNRPVPAVPQSPRQAGRSDRRVAHVRASWKPIMPSWSPTWRRTRRSWRRKLPSAKSSGKAAWPVAGRARSLSRDREASPPARGARAAGAHRQGAGRARRIRQAAWREAAGMGSRPKERTRWHALDAIEMGATYRAQFTRQADGSIFVEGDKAKGLVSHRGSDSARSRHRHSPGSARRRSAAQSRPRSRRQRKLRRHRVRLRAGCRRPAPLKLVRSWDFSGPADDWQS